MFSRKVRTSFAQIALVMLVLPFVLILAVRLMPQQETNLFLGILDDIPLLGDILGVVDAFSAASASDSEYLLFFENITNILYASVADAMLIGMCIQACREVCVLAIPGVPALGVLAGSILGCVVVESFKTAEFMVKVESVAFLAFLNILLIIFTEVHRDRIKKTINIFFMGFQGIIGWFSMFFAACVMKIAMDGILNFNTLVRLWLFPALLLTAMIVTDYFIATAK